MPKLPDRERGFLEHNARTRVALIRDLASGELSSRALSRKYGCVQSSITEFKQRHIDEINAVRADLTNLFAGLWIADKAKRLAAYQHEAEQMEREAEKAVDGRLIIGKDSPDPDDLEDGTSGLEGDTSGALARLYRARDRALRSVAEELGHLPTRTTIALDGTATVRHIIEGVDIDKL